MRQMSEIYTRAKIATLRETPHGGRMAIHLVGDRSSWSLPNYFRLTEILSGGYRVFYEVD